ncbi:MAG: single-stranded-DNA-specific exonuclease RecJ [Thermoanaerobaculia bacterium]
MDSLWRIPRADSLRAEALAVKAGLPLIVATLLIARGIETPEEASHFFHPDATRLHDPFAMLGAEEAVAVLLSAARAGRRIVVFGDYDVDGVTAVAQLRATLLRAGADAVAFLPHRLRDGYGLKPETVRRVLEELRPAVLITVDCGISAVEGVAVARQRGVQVVVTDHHLVPDQLPRGAVLVNPKQPGCAYPYKELAACGIAMKIAEAVAQRAGLRMSRESLLRAVCLGTIADLVPLTGENRVLAAAGLAALARPRAPGLRALLAESGVAPGQPPTAEEVAFRIAPRLNAAGRLDTAQLALSLFEERDPALAARTARQLTLRNAERQRIERGIARQARERIGQEFDPNRDAVIVLAEQGWHRGVLGIVASRLAREYHRPVVLLALEGERASGSGRSIPGVSLHGILKEISHLCDEFGGHEQAVGVSLPTVRVPEFCEALRTLFAARVAPQCLQRVNEAEAELPLGEATPELLAALEPFEPHGMGNPRPVFHSTDARLAGQTSAVSESGVRGRLRAGATDLRFVCWRKEILEPISGREGPFEIQYRLRRGRSGEPEAEVLAARPALYGRETAADPGPLPRGEADRTDGPVVRSAVCGGA